MNPLKPIEKAVEGQAEKTLQGLVERVQSALANMLPAAQDTATKAQQSIQTAKQLLASLAGKLHRSIGQLKEKFDGLEEAEMLAYYQGWQEMDREIKRKIEAEQRLAVAIDAFKRLALTGSILGIFWAIKPKEINRPLEVVMLVSLGLVGLAAVWKVWYGQSLV